LFRDEVRKLCTSNELETVQVGDGFEILHVASVNVKAESVLVFQETDFAATIRELAIDLSESAKQVARSNGGLSAFTVDDHVRARVRCASQQRARRRSFSVSAERRERGGEQLGHLLVASVRQQLGRSRSKIR
jgi:hypothetical protein